MQQFVVGIDNSFKSYSLPQELQTIIFENSQEQVASMPNASIDERIFETMSTLCFQVPLKESFLKNSMLEIYQLYDAIEAIIKSEIENNQPLELQKQQTPTFSNGNSKETEVVSLYYIVLFYVSNFSLFLFHRIFR
jgi:hypothetical protein